MVYLHILAGCLALAAGAAALWARKGGWLHRRGGMLFVLTMLLMALTGAGMAWFKAKPTSVLGGLVTAYFVLSAWLTVRRETSHSRRWQALSMLAGLLIGSGALLFWLDAMAQERARPEFLVFGVITLAAGLLDLRLYFGSPLSAAHRLARHLWRMGFALLLATISLFLGQTQVFPEPLRRMELLVLPVLAVVLITAFWLIRVLMVGRHKRAARE
jgi:hypothetical protein